MELLDVLYLPVFLRSHIEIGKVTGDSVELNGKVWYLDRLEWIGPTDKSLLVVLKGRKP